MEFVGQLVKQISVREGEGQNGHWKIAQYLLQEVTMYPKRLAVDVRDDSYGIIQQFDGLIGKNVKVQYNIDANISMKDGQEKWYNNVRAYRIKEMAEELADGAAVAPVTQQPDGKTNGSTEQPGKDANGNDLPF